MKTVCVRHILKSGSSIWTLCPEELAGSILTWWERQMSLDESRRDKFHVLSDYADAKGKQSGPTTFMVLLSEIAAIVFDREYQANVARGAKMSEIQEQIMAEQLRQMKAGNDWKESGE